MLRVSFGFWGWGFVWVGLAAWFGLKDFVVNVKSVVVGWLGSKIFGFFGSRPGFGFRDFVVKERVCCWLGWGWLVGW